MDDDKTLVFPKKCRKLKVGYTTTVCSCARCGKDHNHLHFSPFTSPVEEDNGVLWTHFAICPETNEPILGRCYPVNDTVVSGTIKIEQENA